MGNVQASIANQILPFESYIVDLPEFKYLHSLGSTRFMKVGCVEHAKGPLVIKVFVLADQSYNSLAEIYRSQILHIRRRLSSPNCCPFTHVYVTSRCAILCRPYLKFTLYDRLSTRPFLLHIEKLWVAFQLLKTLAQCRIAMVKHGDIKSQNILVSSSLWIQLTDFATFKPAYLPSDDPSDFTYFFDTSRKRHCYLSPERFKTSDELNYNIKLPGDFASISDGLNDSMDIFSMGCVLVELFTDGRTIPFTLSQVIDYKRMEAHNAREYVRNILTDVPEEFHELLFVMLDRNPKHRKEEYTRLSPAIPSIFPPIFEKDLYRYIRELQTPTSADDTITKLYVERENYFALLEQDNFGSALIFINVVTSTLRGCHSLTSKMDSITLLYQLSKFVNASVILDRIVPFLVHLITDRFPQVRSEAIYILTEILSAIESIPRDESRLLIDYVFPKIKFVVLDNSPFVRIALATNLGKLAMISLRFLNETASKLDDQSANSINKNDICEINADEEEKLLTRVENQALLDTVYELFVNLCGSENDVRRCLFNPENLDLLCQFFGSTRAIDILMHMITLLNDKPDWRIRATYFQSCPVIAKYLGQNRSCELKPFLQQGLQDHEEFVVSKALKCIHSLCKEKLLNKSTILELIEDVVPYLIHPNKWLRTAVVNILSVWDSMFSMPEVYCRLTPAIKFFLRENLIRLNDIEVIYETLNEPISRQIWDCILRVGFVPELINTLENRKTMEKLGGGKNSLFSLTSSASTASTYNLTERSFDRHSTSSDNQSQVEATIRKLRNMGMNEHIEDKLLAFKNILLKMDLSRKIQSREYSEASRIFLDKLSYVSRKIFDLESGTLKIIDQRQISSHKVHPLNSFEPSSFDGPIRACASARILLEETLRHKQQLYREQKRITTTTVEMNNDIIARIAAATLDSDNSIAEVKKASNSSLSKFQASKRRPKIRLLVHMNEHSEKITRLALHPDRDHFASSSGDKSVKIWCASSLQNNTQPAALSKDTLRYAHPITSCGFLGGSGGQSSSWLVMACGDASLQVFDINKKHLLKSHQFDRENEGLVTDIYCFEHLIFALTHHSNVYCFDLRMSSKNARNAIELSSIWKRQSRNSYGLITSFCVDPNNQQWMLTTASSATTKNMILWDLRFGGLEVSSWSHPSDRVIPLRSWALSNGSHSNRAFTSCTYEGEVSLWDLSTQSRTDVFWPSLEPPLTYKREFVSTALVPSAVDNGVVFVGDSEGSLRCWNLETADSSSYLCGSYRKHLSTSPSTIRHSFQELKPPTSQIVYNKVKLKDSLVRIQIENRSQQSQILDYYTANFQVSECHQDAITDLLSLWPDILVSSCHDGTINLWKIC